MVQSNDGLSLWGKIWAYAGHIALWPLVKLVERERKRTNLQMEGYLRSTPKPRRLKQRRRGRSLTIDQTSRRQSSIKQDCSLFHLSRELRDIVWKYVVTGKVVHWTIVNRKLAGDMCRMEADPWISGCGRYSCLAYGWSQNVGKLRNGALGLVSSCRQM